VSSPVQRQKLEWRTRLGAELVRLGWPIAVSTLSYSLMTVVDTLFVGRLGASALAGVGLGGVISFTLLCFGVGLLRSLKVVISQACGAGRRNLVPGYLKGGLAVTAAVGAAAALVGPLIGPLVRMLAAGEETGHFAQAYLTVRSLGAPFALFAVALRETRYGLGDSRTPMRAALCANLANIPLNALFIFGLGWGVRGAAVATVLAYVVELALLARSLNREELRQGRFEWTTVREVWRIGVPLGAEFFLDVSAFSFLAVLIARMGEVQLAGHQIALQLSQFVFLPAIALADAASILAGQAVGANDDPLVHRVARRGLALCCGYTTAAGVVFGLCAESLVRGFSPDPAVQNTAAGLLRCAAVLNAFFGAHVVARSVLRGTGDVRFSAYVTVTFAWVVTPPITIWLGLREGWGALGGWVGLCVEVLVGAVLLWWRLGRGHWARAAHESRVRIAQPAQSEGLSPQPLAA